MVKVVKVRDILKIIELKDHPRGVKHVSYHNSGLVISTSCADGSLRFFSISSEEPELVQTIEGICPSSDGSDSKSISVAWHPDGQCLALPLKTFEIALYSRDTWKEVSRFRNGHGAIITDLEWSPNGLFLASSSSDGKTIIWDFNSKEVVADFKIEKEHILDLDWHPKANVLSLTTSQGRLYTLPSVIPQGKSLPYGKVHSASASAPKTAQDDGIDNDGPDMVDMGYEQNIQREVNKRLREEEGLLDSDDDKPLDDWIEDDDDGGYVEHNRILSNSKQNIAKRYKGWTPESAGKYKVQDSFQSGSTPWRTNRRYLCMNYVGYIWSVAQQESHNTITVSFFDRGLHREYHFTDYANYSVASLSAEACLFATRSGKVLLRFHDGFSDNWEYDVSSNDSIKAISLSKNLVVLCTEKGYIRIFNLFGTPLRVHRQCRDQVVCCASWKDYIMIVRGNDSGSGLTYTIEDCSTDQIYQKDDVLDIANDGQLQSAFFSENGDPCIFDNNGVLLVLTHWREPLQAKWVPIFCSKEQRGDRQESYWPLGISQDKFNCIILKGGEKYPPIPLPIFTEFGVSVPMDGTISQHEKDYLTRKVLYELQRDRENSLKTDEDEEISAELSSKQLELDKLLLHMLQQTCKDGKTSKALGIVSLISKDQALEAASKIALRLDMTSLAEKINHLREQRLGEF